MLAAGLLLASLGAAQLNPPSNVGGLRPFEASAPLLHRRGIYCPSGMGVCADKLTCAPMDADCCGQGTFCVGGFYCMAYGCCPTGHICSGTAGTITLGIPGTYAPAATATSDAAEPTFIGTRITPNPSPTAVSLGAAATKVVDWHAEVAWEGAWYEWAGWSCGPGRTGMQCYTPDARATIHFDDGVAGYTISALSGTGGMRVYSENIEQTFGYADFHTDTYTGLDENGDHPFYQLCNGTYTFKYVFTTSNKSLTIGWWIDVPHGEGGSDKEERIQINEIKAYKNAADLDAITKTVSSHLTATVMGGTTSQTKAASPTSAPAAASGGASSSPRRASPTARAAVTALVAVVVWAATLV